MLKRLKSCMVFSTSQATPEGFAISCRHARLRPGMQLHSAQRKRSIAATHLDLIFNLDCPAQWRQFFLTLLCKERSSIAARPRGGTFNDSDMDVLLGRKCQELYFLLNEYYTIFLSRSLTHAYCASSVGASRNYEWEDEWGRMLAQVVHTIKKYVR